MIRKHFRRRDRGLERVVQVVAARVGLGGRLVRRRSVPQQVRDLCPTAATQKRQQRRTRAEKAFHAAEQLRQEYDAAAAESEVRASALRNEVDQVRIRLEKVRAEREVIDRDIAAQRLANEKAKSQQGIGLGMLPFVGGGGDATESSSSTGGLHDS